MEDKYLHEVPESPLSAPKRTLTPSENLRDSTLRDEPLDDVPVKKEDAQPEDNTYQEQSTAKVALLIVSCLLSMFLVALDRTIISTAIPKITNDFNSLPDVGWYGSAYLLTCCAFQLLFGKLYTMYSVKGVLLSSIVSFEIASAICGAATSSVMFIVGRAISGVGAAGIFAGTIVAITYAVPLQKRPAIQGLFGALFGLASVFGPLVGGAFTSNVSWRWCFYINLPFGAIAMVVIAVFLVVPDRDSTKLPWLSKILQLDIPGSIALLPGVVCILLALQWGGQTYAWGSWRIILLLALGGVLLIIFVTIQIFIPRTAMIPTRVFKGQRSVALGLWSTACIGCSQYVYVYFLPIWFQSIKSTSPVSSGVRIIPLMLAMVVGSIIGGATTGKIGYYVQYGIIGSAIMTVGSGLLTTLNIHSGKGAWIGFQVVYGLGMGLCFQVPNLAVQTVLPVADVPIGLALMFFGQLFGAAIIVSVCQNVLDNELIKRLANIPGFDPRIVTSGGATDLIKTFAPQYQDPALIQYNLALRKVFDIGLIVSALAILGAIGMEWRSIKEEKKPKDDTENGQELEAVQKN